MRSINARTRGPNRKRAERTGHRTRHTTSVDRTMEDIGRAGRSSHGSTERPVSGPGEVGTVPSGSDSKLDTRLHVMVRVHHASVVAWRDGMKRG